MHSFLPVWSERRLVTATFIPSPPVAKSSACFMHSQGLIRLLVNYEFVQTNNEFSVPFFNFLLGKICESVHVFLLSRDARGQISEAKKVCVFVLTRSK